MESEDDMSKSVVRSLRKEPEYARFVDKSLVATSVGTVF